MIKSRISVLGRPPLVPKENSLVPNQSRWGNSKDFLLNDRDTDTGLDTREHYSWAAGLPGVRCQGEATVSSDTTDCSCPNSGSWLVRDGADGFCCRQCGRSITQIGRVEFTSALSLITDGDNNVDRL